MREAQLGITDGDLAEVGIGELHAHCRSAGLRDLTSLDCRGDGAEVLVTVEDALEPELLDALDYVEAWEPVAEGDVEHQYRIAFTAPAVPESAAETADELVGTCDPDVEPGGAELSLVGDHADIGDAVAEYEAAGLSPDLRSLGRYDGVASPLDALTDRQREVLATAWELGYFEVPREADAAAVAAELEIDDSTVVEHLQRAERNLLGEVLGERD